MGDQPRPPGGCVFGTYIHTGENGGIGLAGVWGFRSVLVAGFGWVSFFFGV